MKFPLSVIEDLARTMRNPDYIAEYPAFTAYSEALIAQHLGGASIINEDIFETLAMSKIEAYLPLPHRSNAVCTKLKSMRFDSLPVLKYEPAPEWNLLFPMFAKNANHNWGVMVECDDGEFYAIAHPDPYFFEPGELIKKVNKPEAPVFVSHCYITPNFVTWVISTWAAVAVIFGDTAPGWVEFERCEAEHNEEAVTPAVEAAEPQEFDCLTVCCDVSNINWQKVFTATPGFRGHTINPGVVTWDGFVDLCGKFDYSVWDYTYKRPFPNDPSVPQQADVILENLLDIEKVVISNAIFDVLGITKPCNETTPATVATLLQELGKMQEETVEVQVDEEKLQVIAQVQKVLELERLYRQILAMPKKKRTAPAIKALINDTLYPPKAK